MIHSLSRTTLLIIFLLLASLSFAAEFTGKVVGVTDGDTLKVLHTGKEKKVRLYGVDSPEKKQAFGERAKLFTSDLCFGKVVTVKVKDTDRYGRTVGVVVLPDGRDLGLEIVGSGMGWWYEQYAPNDKDLQEAEKKARRDKKGLWVDKAPVAPWV